MLLSSVFSIQREFKVKVLIYDDIFYKVHALIVIRLLLKHIIRITRFFYILRHPMIYCILLKGKVENRSIGESKI